MEWAQSHLNAIFEPVDDSDALRAPRRDAFEDTFAKNVHVMLNMCPASREQLRERVRRQRANAPKVVQQWYASFEIVDVGTTVDRPVRIFV